MRPTSDRTIWFVVLLVLLGAAIRVGPLFHDFWLDEAWSFLIVRDWVDTPSDILTRLQIDNNHPLNSLWLFLVGDSLGWPILRVPAFVSGVLLVPLSGWVMKRFGTRHAICTMILVACSYPLIVYSTEARGYGPMLLFALAAVYAICRRLETAQKTACVLFWVAVMLGFLSHLTFLHCYAAIFAYSVYELRKRRHGLAPVFRELVICHGIPLLFLIGLYATFIRHMQIGGAEPSSLGAALGETVAMILGLPEIGATKGLAVVMFVALLFEGFRRLHRKNPGWQWLFFSGIVFFPLLLAAMADYSSSTPISHFPRYFLTSLLLCLLLFGFLIGELSRGTRREQILGGALMLAIVAGNLIQATRFILIGRGQYRKAMAVFVETSAPGTIHIGGNSDFRTRVLLEFYSRDLPKDRRIQYHSRFSPSAAPRLNWWIIETLNEDASLPEEWTIDSQRFQLKEAYTFFGPSGSGWALYRRIPASQSEEQDD